MSVLINSPHKEFGFSKFAAKKANKLLIIGYSGSGKTTIAKKLAILYEATYISLDDFFYTNYKLKMKAPNTYKELFTPLSKNIRKYHVLINKHIRELHARHRLRHFVMPELNRLE